MRAELHIIRDYPEVRPSEELTAIRLDDIQFGGLISALIHYTQGELNWPPDHEEIDALRRLLGDIQDMRVGPSDGG